MTQVVTQRFKTHSTPKTSDVIHAELIRTKGSALQWFPLIGLLIGIVSSTLAFWSSGKHDASGALSWQAMYVTGMAAPLLALLAGLAEDRERVNRHGGTNLRPVSPYSNRAARIGVLIGISALFHVLNFGSAWVITALEGREGASSLLSAGALAFLGSIPTLGVFSIIARYLPLVPTLLVSVACQVIGTLMSESSLWLLLPPTWPVRLLLPVLGVHSNAVPLAAGDLLAHESPVRGIVLNVLFALVAVTLAIVVRNPQRKVTGKEKESLPRKEVAPVQPFQSIAETSPEFSTKRGSDRVAPSLSSIGIAIFRSSVPWLFAALAAVFGVMAVVYPADYISGFYTFFILPLGSGLLSVLIWRLISPPWTISVFENGKMRISYLLWHFIVVVVLAVTVGACHQIAGGHLPDTMRLVALWSTTGMILATISTTLCVSYGAGPTIAWSIIVTVIAATLGGDVLADSILWVAALPAWPVIANTPGRLLFAGTAEFLILALAARWFFGALRQFERMS